MLIGDCSSPPLLRKYVECGTEHVYFPPYFFDLLKVTPLSKRQAIVRFSRRMNAFFLEYHYHDCSQCTLTSSVYRRIFRSKHLSCHNLKSFTLQAKLRTRLFRFDNEFLSSSIVAVVPTALHRCEGSRSSTVWWTWDHDPADILRFDPYKQHIAFTRWNASL